MNVSYKCFNEVDVIGVSDFVELLESSSQACAWRDAYA